MTDHSFDPTTDQSGRRVSKLRLVVPPPRHFYTFMNGQGEKWTHDQNFIEIC